MGRRTKRATLAAVGLGLVWPAAAWADKQITADPSNRYGTPEVTIDQGEKLTFRNNDVADHDVNATDRGPDGKPLFATPLVSNGQSAFVEGSQYLKTGRYQFFCSLHQNMKGTLNVTGNGTPQPRPAGGGGSGPAAPGGGGGPAASDDKQAPAVGVTIMSRATRAVRRSRALRAQVTLDETAHVTLRAVARPRPGAKLITFAVGAAHLSGAGKHRVRLRLTRAGRRALARKRQLAVVVVGTARDSAGNRARAEHGRTLGLKG